MHHLYVYAGVHYMCSMPRVSSEKQKLIASCFSTRKLVTYAFILLDFVMGSSTSIILIILLVLCSASCVFSYPRLLGLPLSNGEQGLFFNVYDCECDNLTVCCGLEGRPSLVTGESAQVSLLLPVFLLSTNLFCP